MNSIKDILLFIFFTNCLPLKQHDNDIVCILGGVWYILLCITSVTHLTLFQHLCNHGVRPFCWPEWEPGSSDWGDKTDRRVDAAVWQCL